MYVYLLSYLAVLSYALITTLFLRKRPASSGIYPGFFMAMLPAIVFVALRGNVGTDTDTYHRMIEALLADPYAGSSEFDVEIGFFFLLRFLMLFMNDPRVILNSISLFIALYSYFLFSKKQYSTTIFCLLIFPMFFFDMSMNGLRYALAFLLAKHASDNVQDDRKISGGILLLLSVSLQISGILVFFLMQLHKMRFRHALYSIPLMVIFYYAFDERLLYKFAAYQDLAAPTGTSGLFPLIIFFSCYATLVLARFEYAKLYFPILLLEIASFMLTRITYAGLRFQLLVLFSFLCCISVIELQKVTRNIKMVYGLFIVIGMLCFIGTVKHYIDDEGEPPSPFLPYQYFWDVT